MAGLYQQTFLALIFPLMVGTRVAHLAPTDTYGSQTQFFMIFEENQN